MIEDDFTIAAKGLNDVPLCNIIDHRWKSASRPPLTWFLPVPNVCGGAQRGISLATGFFTGESTWNPLREVLEVKFFNNSWLQDTIHPSWWILDKNPKIHFGNPGSHVGIQPSQQHHLKIMLLEKTLNRLLNFS
jgi:hypothetical protein